MANENNNKKDGAKKEKVAFTKKVSGALKALPEKHPKVAKAGKVAVNVGKTALKAAFVAGAGTVAALTILDKTGGSKKYATLPSIGDHPELNDNLAADVIKAAENSGMTVEEVKVF